MPKGRRKTVVTEEQVIGENDEDVELTEDEAEEEELGELAKTLDLGQTGMVRLYRRAPGGSKFYFTESIPAEVFALDGVDAIKNKFGGGEYRLQFVRENKVVKSKSLFIDPRLKGSIDQPDKPGDALAPLLDKVEKLAAANNGNNNTQLFVSMMQMIQSSQERTFAVLAEAMKANKPQPGPNFADMGKMLIPFTPLLRDLIIRRSDPAGAMKDMAAIVRSIPEIMAGRGKEEEPARDTFWEKLLELAGPALMAATQPRASMSAIAGPASDSTGSPVFQQPAASPAVPVDINANNPTLAGPPVSLPDDPVMLRMIVIQAIRAQYPKLLRAAQKGTPAESYFDVIADEYEDESPRVLETLIAILREPNWQQTLFGQATLPEAEWFEALRTAFIDYADQPEAKEEAK